MGGGNGSKYRLEITNDDVIVVRERYVSIEGLQIKLTATVGSKDAIYRPLIDGGSVDAELRVSNNIIKGDISGAGISYVGGITASGSGNADTVVGKVWNNIVYDFYNKTDSTQWNDAYGIWEGLCYFYNNTAVNSNYGFHGGSGATKLLYNNLSYNDTYNSDFTDYQWVSSPGDNNLSSDDTSPDGANFENKTVSFRDEANDDFHLAVDDTSAKGAGLNLYSESTLPITTDIEGESRPSPLSYS